MANETKWSAGPWRLIKRSNQLGIRSVIVHDKSHLKAVASFSATNHIQPLDKTTIADAHLIAAAPELYEALALCEGFCKGHQETPEKVDRYKKVVAALTKARGE